VEEKMTYLCSGNKNKLRTFVYNLNEKWKNKYSINVNNKCVCLICNVSVAVSKKCNVERYFMTMMCKDYVSKYPSNSEIQRNIGGFEI
jgi:hypothetical protein